MSMGEPTDPALIDRIARLVLDSHDRGLRCQRCTDVGCGEPDWARLMLRQVAVVVARRQAEAAAASEVVPAP